MLPTLIEKLTAKFGDQLQQNVPFSEITTVGIGGNISFLIVALDQEELIDIVRFSVSNQIPFLVIGGGSNLLVSDEGFDGLVIQNQITGITQTDNRLTVKPGTILQNLVDYTIEHSLSGIHKMTGIPGTVGGAVYGNAGAYGQTISDHLISVLAYDYANDQIKTFQKELCNFSYRESEFKKNKALILAVEFEFSPGDKETLQQEADSCLALRLKKYPPGIKCPGSFFKNVLTETLSQETLQKLPPYKDTYGKIPAWLFLDTVGAKGATKGAIKIADFHGNLFCNLGEGKAADFWELAKHYSSLVAEKFKVRLEPEVQFVNLPSLWEAGKVGEDEEAKEV